MLLLLWALWSLPPDAAAAPLPLVVLPPFFRPNATNSIVVAAAKSKYDVVDIHIEIRSFKGNEASVVLVEKLRSKKAGVPNSVSFHLADNVENAELTVFVQGHDRFYTHVRVSPDVAALHLQTDKPAYRAGETVSIRALPLTYDGSIFDGVVEFCLVNPNGFELVRKRNRTNSEGYIALQFELPTHLLYGQWHVLATPMPVNKHVRAEHKVEFLVKDYALPSFKILTAVREGQPLSSTEITVQARYFHGAPVSGTLLLSCSVPRHNLIENKPIQILQSYVHDGKWRQSVNLSSCFTDDLRRSTVILVQIRDRGTGSRTDAATVFDPLAAGFEIVPLRPVFGTHTRHILLVTHPTEATPGSMLNVTIECLGEVRRPTVLAKVPLGDVLNVVKPDEWAQCHVIMIQASRIVGTAASRTKVLLHPSVVGLSSVEPSWIEVRTAKSIYLVGEKFVVTVPGSVLQSLNYIVTCNTHTPIGNGQVAGNGEISIEVTTAMVGTCMLVVYSTGPKAAADVVQFKVEEHCQVSVVASKTNISPGSHLSLTMIGKPLGMTFVQAIDGRLNTLKAVNAGPTIKYVDFGIFAHPEMLDNQMQLLNFVDRSKLKETLEQNCATSSLFYYERHGSCPDVRISQSALSNYCFRVMAAACLNKQQPEVAVSTICDLRNPRTCGLHLKKVMSFPRSRLIQTFEDTAAKPFSDISNALGEEEVMVRERFHEVWLFDIVPLGPSGTVSRTVEAPHNVGSWSVALGFWGPGQRELCPAGVEISATKEVFMEVYDSKDWM
ncbi:hypothetical protein Q1695_014307 [Nippostrongylus brasiliensis]|nr:hypothetical protein Q1695_014307 [Nippostrongylus brasiliensis]